MLAHSVIHRAPFLFVPVQASVSPPSFPVLLSPFPLLLAHPPRPLRVSGSVYCAGRQESTSILPLPQVPPLDLSLLKPQCSSTDTELHCSNTDGGNCFWRPHVMCHPAHGLDLALQSQNVTGHSPCNQLTPGAVRVGNAGVCT